MVRPTDNVDDVAAQPKIPRPPNSWILFRADMAALMAVQEPNSQRSQAEVSKRISQMWKSATPEVKAEYERRADLKKLEHARMYPDYRYSPKTKDEKEREREAQKQLKNESRVAKKLPRKSSGPVDEEVLALGNLPFSFSGTMPPPRYGPAGPSPPLSAANSPSPGANTHECHPTQVVDPSDITSFMAAVPVAHPVATHPYHPALADGSSQHAQLHVYYHQEPSLDQPRHKNPRASSSRARREAVPYNASHRPHLQQKQEVYQISEPEQTIHEPHATSTARLHNVDTGLSASSILSPLPDASAILTSNGDNNLVLGLPPLVVRNVDNWSGQNPEFQPTYCQALGNTSGEENCFQLSNRDDFNLPCFGPLEVELGLMLPWKSDLNNDTFIWSGSSSNDMDNHSQQDTQSQAQFHSQALDAFWALSFGQPQDVVPPTSQTLAVPEFAAPTAEPCFDDSEDLSIFLNFDSYETQPTETPVPFSPSELAQVPPSPNTYHPPAGAALSSMRRAAGSWTRPFPAMLP